MSRRKVDYVYVPKKKIKKVVIDAKKGSKSVEKTVNNKQILDGAYVRASAMKEFRNHIFAKGGIVKGEISVGDIVMDNRNGNYYIVYEVQNGTATKRYELPREVAESIAIQNNPEIIDWNRYTMYSDQVLPTFSVGDMVYVEKHRKSGVIIGLGSRPNGEMYYTVKFANDTQDSVDDSELELISTYKRGGNIGSYNTGRSWTLDHNQHNKRESYEIPMDDRKFAKGGTIKNQYAGKTAREVWGMWTPQQRVHFLGDHYLVGEYRPENIAAISKMTYDELRSKMATISGGALYTLEDHIMQGQYKRGGNIGSYNTGRSWTLDHNQHNKQESYEIPMDDRKYAKGGKVGVEEKKYMLLYDFVDEKMIEGDIVAKKMIKSKGYSLTYDELYNFVDEKMVEGDSVAKNLLKKVNSLYETGGEIPDLSNMNIDHLFANGGRPYPMTEEKIYS
jgi:hypothetical protein